MKAVYVQRGESIDYIPTADVAAGEIVIQGGLVGITKLDIKANELGALATVGVYDIVKAAGAVSVGADVYYDSASGNVTATAGSNVKVGVAVASAAANDVTVRVLLNA